MKKRTRPTYRESCRSFAKRIHSRRLQLLAFDPCIPTNTGGSVYTWTINQVYNVDKKHIGHGSDTCCAAVSGILPVPEQGLSKYLEYYQSFSVLILRRKF